MSRLFVDCDDTLVIWNDTHQNQDKTLWIRDDWSPNQILIDNIYAYLKERPDLQLVVWTGGGAHYAFTWANRFFPDQPCLVMAKDIRLPVEGDICIDDEQIKVKGSLMTADEFIEAVFSFRG